VSAFALPRGLFKVRSFLSIIWWRFLWDAGKKGKESPTEKKLYAQLDRREFSVFEFGQTGTATPL